MQPVESSMQNLSMDDIESKVSENQILNNGINIVHFLCGYSNVLYTTLHVNTQPCSDTDTFIIVSLSDSIVIQDLQFIVLTQEDEKV